ncbi:UNVERIFIED_CONTAM: hypothetical protein FKN15_066801 [Acipenser sinensis]
MFIWRISFGDCGKVVSGYRSDLDWNSRVRWLPHPRYSDAPFPEIKAIRFPSETRLLRSFPEANMESNSEWTFYPRFGLPVTYHFGKKCTINGVHVRNLTSTSEQTVPMMVGRKKQSECWKLRVL